MRHGKKFNHLGRTASHRSAMLSNMASSLIKHKRINTTVAKAKALKKFVEPLITKAKDDSTHSRRVVFSYLQDKETVTELFGTVADKVASRPGGYTRILKLGARLGDNAEMCMMELVDFNDLLLEEAPAPTKSRRSRRGKSKKSEEEQEVSTPIEEAEVIEEEAVVEEVAPEAEADPAIEKKTPEVSSEDEGSSEEGENTEEDKKAE